MKKKKSICFGNIKYFLYHDKIRVSFFNIPIVKIKFYNNYSVFFLFYFFPIWLMKLQYKKIDIKLDTKNFNNINIDDTNLINELSDIGEFTYIPNPGNMGDMLIAAATLQFFKKYNLKFNIYNGTNIAKTVVYGGGGAWIGNYKNYWQPLLEKLSKAEKIIILPSSFNDCQHFIDSIDNRYTIFCREKKSYNYLLSRNTTAKIILDYDMAFRLNESIFDSELNISFKEKLFLYVIYKKLKTLRSTVKFIRQDKEAKKTQDTDLDLSLCLVSNSIFCEDFVIFATLTLLSAIDKFDTIITDRLHVGISSILMSKKLFLLDNSYGKVFEVFNHTLPNDCNICFIENLPDKFEKNTKNGTNNIDILMHNIFC